MTSPPTTAPAVESRPPRTAAGMAVSASSPVALFTPAAGKLVKNAPPTAASAPASAQAPAATRVSRMPMSAAISQSAAAERIATPQSLYLNAAAKASMSATAIAAAARRVCGTAMPSTCVTSEPHGAPAAPPGPPRGRRPRPAPPRELGAEQDVEADREDRQRVDAAAVAAQHP